MLCQKCGLTEATVHRQTKVFRQKIEEHLCALCAGALDKAKLQEPRAHIVPPPVAVISRASRGSASELRRIIVKRPIVVRDLAIALGLQPFKLISELNQLVGFAAMNSKIGDPVAQKVAEKYGFRLTGADE
jgi:hypothetical protein